MKFIMYKKRTEKEVVEKFKNEDKDLLEETIEKLKELGYINDREYIERFANEAMSLKNLSIFELKYKLYSKGYQIILRHIYPFYFYLLNDIINLMVLQNFLI